MAKGMRRSESLYWVLELSWPLGRDRSLKLPTFPYCTSSFQIQLHWSFQSILAQLWSKLACVVCRIYSVKCVVVWLGFLLLGLIKYNWCFCEVHSWNLSIIWRSHFKLNLFGISCLWENAVKNWLIGFDVLCNSLLSGIACKITCFIPELYIFFISLGRMWGCAPKNKRWNAQKAYSGIFPINYGLGFILCYFSLDFVGLPLLPHKKHAYKKCIKASDIKRKIRTSLIFQPK